MKFPAPLPVIKGLLASKVDFVLIGVFGINHYVPDPSMAYATQDCDILIRPQVKHLRRALAVLKRHRYDLAAGSESLPDLDPVILARLVEYRIVVRARKKGSLPIDFVLEASGFSFDQWFKGRHIFRVSGVRVPVASLPKLIQSKRLSGREKDRVFLKLYASQVRDWAESAYHA